MNVTVQDDRVESDGWKWTATESGYEVMWWTDNRLEPAWLMAELMDQARYALREAAA